MNGNTEDFANYWIDVLRDCLESDWAANDDHGLAETMRWATNYFRFKTEVKTWIDEEVETNGKTLEMLPGYDPEQGALNMRQAFKHITEGVLGYFFSRGYRYPRAIIWTRRGTRRVRFSRRLEEAYFAPGYNGREVFSLGRALRVGRW